MAKPVPGGQHTVQTGETLSGIAAQAYGDPAEWPRIFNANQTAIRSGDQNQVAVGEVLFIPVISELDNLKRSFFQSAVITDGVELKIEERVVPVQSAKIIRTMDTVSDAWTATIAWEPGLDPRLDELTSKYKFPRASISLDGELKVSGILYDVEQNHDADGRSKNLWGWSFTIDLADSHPIKPPYEQKGQITLLKRCQTMCEPHGIGVDVLPGLDLGGPFNDVKIEPTQSKFDHMLKLASQRGVLLSSTPRGNLLLTQADLTSPAVGTLEEGVSLVEKWSVKFEGRKRYSLYRVTSQGANKWDKKVGIAKDNSISRIRARTFKVDDALKGEMNDIAAWKRNKQAAKALKTSLPVEGWRGPDGKIWEENKRLTVKSLTLDEPDGFVYLIPKVEFTYDENGKNSTLSLIPPIFYTKQPLAGGL